jgi:hypothetical protein
MPQSGGGGKALSILAWWNSQDPDESAPHLLLAAEVCNDTYPWISANDENDDPLVGRAFFPTMTKPIAPLPTASRVVIIAATQRHGQMNRSTSHD